MRPLRPDEIKIGQRFGRLVLINTNMDGRYRKGVFLCDCGIETIKNYSHVKNGLTTSCGCFQREGSALRHKTHGMTKSTEFTTWQRIGDRCYNINNEKYPRYGARGIIVCERWKTSFENFFEDMGKRPSPKHSIDRIDNDGNYEPNNCRWETAMEQQRNNSRNHWVEHNGKKMILQDWADQLGFSQSYFCTLLKKLTIAQIVEKATYDGRKPILNRKNKKGEIL